MNTCNSSQILLIRMVVYYKVNFQQINDDVIYGTVLWLHNEGNDYMSTHQMIIIDQHLNDGGFSGSFKKKHVNKRIVGLEH